MKRRELLGLGGVVLIAACTSPPEKAEPGDLLSVVTDDGPAVIDSGTGRRVLPAAAGLVTADWSRRVSATFQDGTSKIVTHDTVTGAVVAQTSVRGGLRLAAVAPDAGLVALVDGDPAGRRQTTIVVAGPAGERHRFSLPGFVQPEAFSSAGTSLFVLDMLPPERPDRYRVRVLDLAGEKLTALNLPGENAGVKVLVPPGAEEEMHGEGRQAVYDARRERLYSLYSHQPDHQHVGEILGVRKSSPDVHSFIHALSVKDGWAVCVDLPSLFGSGTAQGAADGLAIGQSPRFADEVWVVDAGKGAVAIMQADALALTQEFKIPVLEGRAALAVTDDVVYLSAGPKVLTFDAATKQQTGSIDLPGQARGVAVSGQYAYVGQDNAIVKIDPVRFKVVGTVRVPGLRSVERSLKNASG